MHFTAKERDSESGLDHFGARYNSSSMGRFMTPDPLLNSGRAWEPQRWNRYAYVLNNPLNKVDPTGLYDLVNNCASDDKKCNKQFRQHADDLKKGLADLQKKVDNIKDGAAKDRLEAALGVVGTEGDHNGVNATFGALQGSAAAETTYNSAENGQLSATSTFDPSKNGGSTAYGINAAHEGTHIEDTKTRLVDAYANAARPDWLRSPMATLSPEFGTYRIQELLLYLICRADGSGPHGQRIDSAAFSGRAEKTTQPAISNTRRPRLPALPHKPCTLAIEISCCLRGI